MLVVGEALIDIVRTPKGDVERVGGSPANVALGLGRRGVQVELATQLADDARGQAITRHLRASGVVVHPLPNTPATTSTTLARIADDGQASYDFNISWDVATESVHCAPRVLHTGSIAAFLEPGASSVRQLVDRTEAAEVTFDPNIRPALLSSHSDAVRTFEHIAGASTVVKLSDEDAHWLYPDLGINDVVGRLLALGPRLAAVTLGSRGAVLANRNHEVLVPGVRVRTVDTIGAGDTFMASLIHSVLERGSGNLSQSDLGTIAEHAVAAAAITVGREGADLPWAHELSELDSSIRASTR